MKRIMNSVGEIVVLLLAVGPSLAAGAMQISAEKPDEDFAFQGEFVGDVGGGDESHKFGLQVIAMGHGKFQAVGYHGGLPGDGWNGEGPLRVEKIGERQGDTLVFSDPVGTATIHDNEAAIKDPDGNLSGTLKKVTRQSRTMNQPAPDGAIILFDGKNVDQWENGQLTDDGLLQQGTTTKQKFGSCTLHIEFRLPYEPTASGQGRGNSGIYLQGRYEVQMLDSFGLEGKDNECGGLYSIKGCDLNMCFPPLSWQTYDLEYTAAKYENGKLMANPRLTAYHNGVKIHDNVELPGDRNSTAAPINAGQEPGPIYLQDHGNPVRYRNIWVLETEK